MIAEYLTRLALLLPLVAGLAWASLWLWRWLQADRRTPIRTDRPLRLTCVMSLGPQAKLAVIDFRGRELLIAVTRNRIDMLAGHQEDDRRE